MHCEYHDENVWKIHDNSTIFNEKVCNGNLFITIEKFVTTFQCGYFILWVRWLWALTSSNSSRNLKVGLLGLKVKLWARNLTVRLSLSKLYLYFLWKYGWFKGLYSHSLVFSARFMEWMVKMGAVCCETNACKNASPHFFPQTNLWMQPLYYILQESSRKNSRIKLEEIFRTSQGAKRSKEKSVILWPKNSDC